MPTLRLVEDKTRGIHEDPPADYEKVLVNADGRCLFCGHKDYRAGFSLRSKPPTPYKCCICSTYKGCVCCTRELRA